MGSLLGGHGQYQEDLAGEEVRASLLHRIKPMLEARTSDLLMRFTLDR
jgi:hypothetical protein